MATLDTSVLRAGIDSAKFRPDDALFISDALSLEISISAAQDGPGGQKRFLFTSWRQSVTVPMDQDVLLVSQQFWQGRDEGPSPLNGSDLSRIDVVCAATAIVYDAPLYTVDPAPYARLGRRVRTIRYGEARR